MPPTTFVLARDRSLDDVKEALVAGRLCVKAPAACSFRVYAEGRSVMPGEALAPQRTVRLSASGQEVRLIVDGEPIFATQRAGSGYEGEHHFDDEGCHALRAEVDGGISGPVYVGCDEATFASAREE